MANHSCPFENCSSTFSRPYRLRIHIKKHQGIKDFVCDQCDRSYHRRQHLQRHVAEAHQNQRRLEEPLSCDHCDRIFNTAWGLRRHQVRIKKQNDRVRRHHCGVCSKRFFTADDLERHNLMHKRFQCEIVSCPRAAHQFTWGFYMRHMAKYHSDPYECEHCGQRFALKYQIRSHIRQHMPMFPCTEPNCDRTFVFYKNLIQHLQFGHGTRRHKCEVVGCDWRFQFKTCLVKHMETHQRNGKIFPMTKKKLEKTNSKFLIAEKLAGFALKSK